MVNKIQFIMTILSLFFKIIDSEVTMNYLKRKILYNKVLLNIAAVLGRSQSVWSLEHSSTFWEVDCQKNGPKFFKENFRMTRPSFNKLCSRLKKMKKNDTNYRKAIPLEKRVAIALYALGSSSEYRSIANLFGVGKATVCKILLEFCNEVWACMAPVYLNSFPLTRAQIEQGVADFNAMGYPQCIGAIDGCHIEIHPKKTEAIDYYNYKGWYSVVLLALVDAKYRFLYIHCGSPGRCNDSSIFEKSSLKQYLQECPLLEEMSWYQGSTKIPVHIIGDSAFRLSQYVMKPYPHNVDNSPGHKLFNYRLSKCRRVVENAFGHLKARFRRIGKGIDNHIKNTNAVISAACVLHNFLIEEKDPILENWLLDMQRDTRSNPESTTNRNDRSEGELIRNTLKEYFGVDASLTAGDDGAGDGGAGNGMDEFMEHDGNVTGGDVTDCGLSVN